MRIRNMWSGVLVAGMLSVLMMSTGCESSSKKNDNNDPLVGTWRAVALITHGREWEMDQIDMSVTLVLRSNGTATVTATEEGVADVEDGTWSATTTVLTFEWNESGREQLDYVLDGNTLRLTVEDGEVIVLNK